MPEIEVEMVKVKDIKEELATTAKASGGKWTALCKEVLETGKAARATGLTKGQVAAAYKTAKATDGISSKTFYKEGTVILYPTPE